MQATVLEEMPPFAEKESSILAVLKKKSGRMSAQEAQKEARAAGGAGGAAAAVAASAANKTLDKTNAKDSTADLFGLNTPPVAQNNTSSSNTGVLVDVLGDLYSSTNSSTTNGTNNNSASPATLTSAVTDNIKKFVCKNNGVLYENDIIQIGVKSEFRQNLGRIGIFYGNKTSMPLQVWHFALIICHILKKFISIATIMITTWQLIAISLRLIKLLVSLSAVCCC